MKNYCNLYCKIHIFFSIVLFLIVLSCETENNIKIKQTNITIRANGIAEFDHTDISSKIGSSKTLSTIEENNKIKHHQYFDAITSVTYTDKYTTPTSNISTKNISRKVNNALSSTQLADTVTYRILFYRVSNNEIVANEVVKANDAVAIYLNTDVPYKWVAYSINQAIVPNFTNNIINRNDLANKDFLYCSGNITLHVGNNALNITFNRYTTQYVVNIDSRGMFADIDVGTNIMLSNEEENLFRTANFDIFNDKFINGTYTPILLSGQKLNPISTHNDQKSTAYYTVDTIPTSTNKLKIDFQPLKIILDENYNSSKIRTFDNATIDLTHNSLFGSNNQIKSTRGRRYTINVKLIESGINRGGTIWARSNLWYDANNTKNKYRFRVSPHFRDTENKTSNAYWNFTDPNDLWRWRSATPSGPVNNTDPCKLVYPQNTWRMPIRSEFNYLINNGIKGFYFIDNNDGKFFTIPISAYKLLEYIIQFQSQSSSMNPYTIPYRTGDTQSTSDDLFFSGVGILDQSNLKTDVPRYVAVVNLSFDYNINLLTLVGSFAGGGYYWIDEAHATINDNAMRYRFSYSELELAGLDLSILKLNILNISGVSQIITTPGINKNYRLNIRCVRASI